MTKVLLLSMLLVLVYQFDELARGALRLVRRVLGQRHGDVIRDTDHYVGTALTIATMPLLLYGVLLADSSITAKMFWLAAIYLGYAVVAAGVGYMLRQAEHLKRYEGYALAFSTLGVIGGLFHPSLNMVPWNAGRERMTYAKLAFLLSLPAMLGAAFKIYYDNYQIEFSQYLDSLIVVMVGGVFINVIIHALEKYFRAHDVGVLGYFRIAAGLGIAFLLIK